MRKNSAIIITLLSQILLCAGGVYALYKLAPYFPAFPWINKPTPSISTDFLLRHELLQPQNENDFSPSAILRRELMQLPPDQDVLLLADPQHPSTYTIRYLISYFAFPRRVITPICNLPNEAKNAFDPARIGAVVIFGQAPKIATTNAPVTILPGLEFRRIGGEERWQSFCSR